MNEIDPRHGTRKLVLTGIGGAAVAVVGGGVLFTYLASTTPDVGAPQQTNAESLVAKNDPAGLEDSTGGRARAIKESAKDLQLTAEQKDRIRQILQAAQSHSNDHVQFELMIGVAVPEQTPVTDIPPDISEVLGGYYGAQHIVVDDKLVIVDRQARRVAAIISGVAPQGGDAGSVNRQ